MRGRDATLLLSLTGLLSLMGLLTGCLYVTEVNERPTAQLVATSTSASLGADIELEAFLSDDQAGARSEIVVRDANGTIVTDDACVVGLHSEAASNGRTLLRVQVWRPGVFTIELTPIDRLGARGSTATVQLRFDDEPPVFTPDPVDHRARVLRVTSAASVCGTNWAASVPIPIQLVGNVEDPDASRPPPFDTCATKAAALSYAFTLVSQPTPTGTLGPAGPGGACPLEPPARTTMLATTSPTVCLYPDPTLSPATSTGYEVKLSVSDGRSDVSTDTLFVPVVNDAPACLDGTYPSAGSYVLSRADTTVFQAIGVDGVTPSPQLAYVWSLRRAGESAYSVVAPETLGRDAGGRLELDPSIYGFAVGEMVSLRVEVVDPDPGDACAPTDDRCEVESCVASTGATCPRRATWSLEFR